VIDQTRLHNSNIIPHKPTLILRNMNASKTPIPGENMQLPDLEQAYNQNFRTQNSRISQR
jgi:hypothetical protein